MRRLIFTALAAALALFAVSLVTYQYLSAPTTLRIAVGPLSSDDTRLIAAVSQHLARERHAVRLKLVLSDGPSGSAAALDEGRAELAVVRTDAAMPARGQTVLILHRDAALLMATPQAGIDRIAGLAGKTVGIVRKNPANRTLFGAVMAHYEVEPNTVGAVMLDPADVADALRAGRIDAVLAVGSLTSRTLTESVAAVTQAGGGPPVFLPITEAEAIAQRLPAFESVEVVRGTFGGSPPRPAETLTTLGVTYRLVAQESLDDGVVAELTRLLFAMRPVIANEVPLANRIEAADTTKDSSLPVHAGAEAYYEGTVQTFFERHGDWLYLGIMVVSIAGSAVAAFAGTRANRSRLRQMALLNKLLVIVRSARQADTEAELVALEVEADDILAKALSGVGQGGVDETGMVAFTLGLDQARRAIAERRQWLGAHPPAPVIPLSQAAE